MHINKKVKSIFLAILICITFVSCGSRSNTPEDSSSVADVVVSSESIPPSPAYEFLGKYEFGMTKNECDFIAEPITLYNRPLTDVELLYSNDKLWTIDYNFAPGVTLDSILSELINELGSYSNYKRSGGGSYLQDSYTWSFNDYYLELRLMNYAEQRDTLDLYVIGK